MRAFRGPFTALHKLGFYTLLIVSIAHVTGVIVTEKREGGGLISTMFTGEKVLRGEPVDKDDD